MQKDPFEIRREENQIRMTLPNSGEIPHVGGIDIYGEEIQLNGEIGGDHIIWLDFNSKKRFDLERRIDDAKRRDQKVADNLMQYLRRGGMSLSDASGHGIAAAKLTSRYHDAFLTSVSDFLYYEGRITIPLFENLNMRFCSSVDLENTITVLYGEIINDGTFRYISAGHPTPVIFSSEYNRIMDIHPERSKTSQPIGWVPSEDHLDRDIQFGPVPEKRKIFGLKKRYQVNELKLLNKGDLIVLYTDGLSELRLKDTDPDSESPNVYYFPSGLQDRLIASKLLSARETFFAIKKDIFDLCTQTDDIAYIIIKRE
ncbi:serine/threonine-protein phosphatase [Candidatus Woesearchaeota archaeon]|nr:serine/threonine-protein phosphatase [Candidatus Woesearchaeota archaeon]